MAKRYWLILRTRIMSVFVGAMFASYPGNVKKSDGKMAQELNYQGVEFPVSVKDYHKIEVESSININVFGYEGKQFYPIFVSFVF